MRVLAVDTALGACSAAVLDGEKILSHRFEEMARGHAEALAPMVESAMTGIAFDSLDRLAVTTGPGTFTGQRVGLAFMRGLRIALRKPLIGVTTLEAMASAASLFSPSALRSFAFDAPARACASASAATGTSPISASRTEEVGLDQGSKVAAIHDAKRDEAYLLLQENGRVVLEPVVMGFAEALARIKAFGPCALAGTGAPAAAASLGAEFSLSPVRQPDALWVGRMALNSSLADGPPAPLYLRAPDAKLPASVRQP
jgi:tRNA threonylcarbamoyladenosine biosynthesis protein TsaB